MDKLESLNHSKWVCKYFDWRKAKAGFLCLLHQLIIARNYIPGDPA